MNKSDSEKQESIFGKFITLLFILGLIYWVIYYIYAGIDYGFLRSEVTTFPVGCSKPDDNYETCLEWKRLDPIKYKIYQEQQYVVLVSSVSNRLERLNNCAIEDRKNWNCGGRIGQFGFKNGNYFDDSTGSFIKFVSKFKWHVDYSK